MSPPAHAAANRSATSSTWAAPDVRTERGASLRIASRARPGELAAHAHGPADDLGDGVVREAEDVVQHERGALGGGEAVEHDAERLRHLVVERHPVGRIDRAGRPRPPARRARPRRRAAARPPPAGVGRPQPVEAHAAHDHGQPAAQVVDGVGVDAGEPAERLLHDVLGLAAAAHHALREGRRGRRRRRRQAALDAPVGRVAGAGIGVHRMPPGGR